MQFYSSASVAVGEYYFIIGFSAGFMETPDIRSMDSEYITGSNFLLGYAKDNVFVIATSGAVGT